MKAWLLIMIDSINTHQVDHVDGFRYCMFTFCYTTLIILIIFCFSWAWSKSNTKTSVHDPNTHYEYQVGIPGHSTEDCTPFKYKVQGLVRSSALNFGKDEPDIFDVFLPDWIKNWCSFEPLLFLKTKIFWGKEMNFSYLLLSMSSGQTMQWSAYWLW